VADNVAARYAATKTVSASRLWVVNAPWHGIFLIGKDITRFDAVDRFDNPTHT